MSEVDPGYSLIANCIYRNSRVALATSPPPRRRACRRGKTIFATTSSAPSTTTTTFLSHGARTSATAMPSTTKVSSSPAKFTSRREHPARSAWSTQNTRAKQQRCRVAAAAAQWVALNEKELEKNHNGAKRRERTHNGRRTVCDICPISGDENTPAGSRINSELNVSFCRIDRRREELVPLFPCVSLFVFFRFYFFIVALACRR